MSNTSFVKRGQFFKSRSSDKIVKVTAVVRSETASRKSDIVRIVSIVDDKVVRGSATLVKADSIRRRYLKLDKSFVMP